MSSPVKILLNRTAPTLLRISARKRSTIIGLHNPMPRDLELILRELSRLGEFVPYPVMAGQVLRGRQPPPGFVITFDDGYRENMAILDTLEAHDCQAMFFVSTACLDSPKPLWFMNIDNAGALKNELRQLPYGTFLREIDRRGLTHPSDNHRRFGLTSAELREIAGRGHQIGVHTHNHVFLSGLESDEITSEITMCADCLRSALAVEHLDLHLAYPDGDYNEHVVAAMATLNIKTAVTTRPGSVGGADATPQALPRVMLSDDDPPGYAVFKVSRLYARLKAAKAA